MSTARNDQVETNEQAATGRPDEAAQATAGGPAGAASGKGASSSGRASATTASAERSGAAERTADAERSMNFRQRVTLSFAIVAVSTTLLFVIVLSIVWSNQFGTYTRDNMEFLASSAATSLADAYDARGYWSSGELVNAASSVSAADGVGIQILDANGIVVYDSTLSGMEWRSTGELGVDMSLAPSDDAADVVTQPVVDDEGETVGTVRVWVYGSDVLLTQRDENFRASSFEAIGLAGLASVLLSVSMGLIFSRLLTKPVRIISNAAQRIKEGDLSARSNVRGSDDLGQLGTTFDAMADSVQRDRELERRLTSDVAHELRTPLMSILATVEAMQDEVLPCDQEHLALVASETKRLSRLVDSMLRLSRLENGSVRLKIEPVDAVEFVGNIARSHMALLEDAGLTMTFANRTGADSLDVELDRDTITQALTNIISNAMRYTPAPGEVEVALDKGDGEVRVSVRDTGIGIAKEDIGNVFGRFWRAEESRNRVAGGLGVGLAVTKEIVDRHHGHIDVESEQGVGTTFTLHLPLVQPRADEPAEGEEGGHGHAGHSHGHAERGRRGE